MTDETTNHSERGDLDRMTKKPDSVQRELEEARRIVSQVIMPPVRTTVKPTNEMIDRLAHCFAEHGLNGCEVTHGGGSIKACVGLCDCRDFARLAFGAMRIPTQAMVLAGNRTTAFIDEIYTAMIDEALRDG